MTEVPTTMWWAFALAILCWVTAPSSLADPAQPRQQQNQQQLQQLQQQRQPPTQIPSEAAGAADRLLPNPVLETRLLTYHRNDDAWLKQAHYTDAATGPRLDDQLLDAVLEGLLLPEAQSEPSFWQTLERWINRYLGNRTDPVLPEWLRNMRLPEQTMLWVFYLSCLLVVLLAIGIVANEVRHARKRRKVPAATTADSTATDHREDPDAEPTSMLELPAWLLRRLTALLRLSVGGIRGDSMTHRELVQAGDGLPGEVSVPLAALARTAERIRYGDEAPDELELASTVQSGVALLESLEERH